MPPGNGQPFGGPTTVPPPPLGGDARVSPLFPALSIAGFVIALALLGTQWLLTRPGQPPGRSL
ncbi:MAG: hypothetical protein KY454_06720 [Actinobacteria bacterium]|nr:hypothetical protein [Actinomycetota bacterium]MBW3651058.1 hypothetical protein [Actinomycetota bacterium]